MYTRLLKIVPVVLCAALAACVDLAPIRDYANAASELTGGREIVTRWKNSDVELNRNTVALSDRQAKPRRDPATQAAADDAASELYKIHDALGDYFSAVAQLAADELPDVDRQASSLSDAIAKLDPGFSAADQAAFKAVVGLLSLPLDAYRQHELHKLLTSQRQNIERLLSILERSGAVIESDLKAEQNALLDRFSALLGDVKDPGMRYLVRERMLADERSKYTNVLAAISRYRGAIGSVRAAHDRIGMALESRGDQLKTLLRNLRAARLQLIDARNAVEKTLQ